MTPAARRFLGIITALALQACSAVEPDAPLPEEESPGAQTSWLVDVTVESGMNFVHETGATGDLLLPEIMTSGGALFDADGDGDLDVYLTNGAWTDGRHAASPSNALYLQVGPWRFEDATAGSGAGDTGYAMGVATGDFDGDGRTDLYVCNVGPDRLLRNLGGGRFEDVTAALGLDVPGWSTTAAFLDFDADGDLDLFVVRYVVFDPERRCTDASGRPDYCGPKSFAPVSDMLWRNDGAVGFTDVSASSGIAAVPGPGLGIVCADLDEDGRIDVYVANDGAANHLWHNHGDGSFEERALLAGCAFNVHGQPEAGMGLVCADVTDDGIRDLFVTHQARETNTLYRGAGGGGFTDATGTVGLGATSLPYTGFGTVAIDLECDGRLDLLAVGGRVLRAQEIDAGTGASDATPWAAYAEPNLVYRWRGGRFELDASAAPEFTGPAEVSRGLAVGDIDRDGDLDLLVTNVQGPARLYRNDAPRHGHWLLVRAIERSGADALGAIVRVVLADGDRRERDLVTASSYQSASAPDVHFGLGDRDTITAIEVRWTDGTWERFDGGRTDRLVELHRGAGTAP